jgi:hypothetical protein
VASQVTGEVPEKAAARFGISAATSNADRAEMWITVRDTRRARTEGVWRGEVFVALTPPGQPAPANLGDYCSIGGITRSETTLSFEPNKGGMQAHDLSRWVSTSGATGPWSDTASATVAA